MHADPQPALFARFCEVFTQEINRLRMKGRANVAAAEVEIKKIDGKSDTLLDPILKGGAADKINAKMVVLEKRQKEVKTFLAEADEPPPLLHPSMAQLYRSRVQGLYDALKDGDEEKRTEAADIIRTLVEDIVLTPVNCKVEIDVRGDLAGILTLSVQTKKLRRSGGVITSKYGCGGWIWIEANGCCAGLEEVAGSRLISVDSTPVYRAADHFPHPPTPNAAGKSGAVSGVKRGDRRHWSGLVESGWRGCRPRMAAGAKAG